MKDWIAGAGVGVFAEEPPSHSNPLILAAKEGTPIILTPHIGRATVNARNSINETTAENVGRALMGAKPEDVVKS
jgi:phosphoglycerate dehydrogenase-like enzyme